MIEGGQVEPESFWLQVGGRQMHSLLWGAASAPAVLLLHGAGMHAHYWDPLVPALAGRYRLVVPDLRGHGRSDWAEPPSYLIEDFGHDLQALLDSLRIDRVAILGHSMGGRVAVWLAAEMGARAWACGVLETRMSALSQERVDSWRGARVGQGKRRGYASEGEARAAFRITPDEPGVAAAIRADLAEQAVVQQADGQWVLRFDRGVLNIEGSRVADFFPLLRRITCPTLVLRGASSTVLGEAGFDATINTLTRGEPAMLPGGHHCVLVDPDVAAAMLRDFLDRAWAAT